ncbi:hypothetical protein GEV33_008412 [Tenebrio molitor]|uniref:Uncharacterized protein n=1 Tax=Tenebrio molitor TaxID=7067 RepID=A0A8J6HGP9_TENMO|nr:hypothetical protein GEV33_008412 [Tenebrio molitor]
MFVSIDLTSGVSRFRVEQNVREIGYKNQILGRLSGSQGTAVKLIRSNNGRRRRFLLLKKGTAERRNENEKKKKIKWRTLALLIALELEGLPTAVKSATEKQNAVSITAVTFAAFPREKPLVTDHPVCKLGSTAARSSPVPAHSCINVKESRGSSSLVFPRSDSSLLKNWLAFGSIENWWEGGPRRDIDQVGSGWDKDRGSTRTGDEKISTAPAIADSGTAGPGEQGTRYPTAWTFSSRMDRRTVH